MTVSVMSDAESSVRNPYTWENAMGFSLFTQA